MAKTFKNLPQPAPAHVAKRASEQDFFDLINDPQSTTVPVSALVANHSPEKIAANGATGSTTKSIPFKVSNRGNTGNKEATDHSGAASLPVAEIPAIGGGDVRQTFVLSQSHLEQLRDHVHARRADGDYNYSQKQALQEALDLLFASVTPASPRPDQAREREQQRRERIQQGRRLRA